jgi:hypothetical protein
MKGKPFLAEADLNEEGLRTKTTFKAVAVQTATKKQPAVPGKTSSLWSNTRHGPCTQERNKPN